MHGRKCVLNGYMDFFFPYYGTRTILALLEKQKKDLNFLRFDKLN